MQMLGCGANSALRYALLWRTFVGSTHKPCAKYIPLCILMPPQNPSHASHPIKRFNLSKDLCMATFMVPGGITDCKYWKGSTFVLYIFQLSTLFPRIVCRVYNVTDAHNNGINCWTNYSSTISRVRGFYRLWLCKSVQYL